ncbi:MAG: toll/interleukin-1 receptor domain-containing protein, partial [Pyrinomonadaceae bacterium]
MANENHLKAIRKGGEFWNGWRKTNSKIKAAFAEELMPDFAGADLNETNLLGADLSGANLNGASLKRANLIDADLSAADLREADLSGADLSRAKLNHADLSRADLSAADLTGADLRGAVLCEALLTRASLSGSKVSGTDLTRAIVGWTGFGNTDLSTTKGLKAVTHRGPSTIGVDTLYQSHGHIPESFLWGAGLPEEFITQIPALVASVRPIQFHSCFISYSHRDEEFAKRLYSAMRSENLRVWYAPEEMEGGKKLH